MSERVAFFDLDRTLLDVNSGKLWLRHEWNEGNVGVYDAAWAVWWLGKYSLGLGDGLQDAYRQAVAMLEGQRERVIEDRTRAWFEEQVRHRLRPGAAEALERHREAGHRLVLATSSSPYASRAAVDAYDLDDYLCTVYEVRDGVFTGRVAEWAVGAAKAERVQEWADDQGVDLDACTFYTDSMTDLALLERVGEPVVVNPDRRLARHAAEQGWQIVDWGTT